MKCRAKWALLPVLCLLHLGLLGASLTLGADEATGEEAPGLADLAAAADLVALAQVRDTDYLRRRDIPVSGSAYLKILIPYKPERPQDLVEVYEKGLRAGECYFPNPTVFEEGRRYLLLLRRDPDEPERYRGLPQGCALDVLVDADNRYAVRWPLTGLQLSARDRAALGEQARPMTFRDPYAVVRDEDLPPAQRDAMLAAGQIAPWSEATDAEEEALLPPSEAPPLQWIYTQGVPLGEFRRLLQLDPQL